MYSMKLRSRFGSERVPVLQALGLINDYPIPLAARPKEVQVSLVRPCVDFLHLGLQRTESAKNDVVLT
jgi:hypothetical protein